MSMRNKILVTGFVVFIPVLSIFGITQLNKSNLTLPPIKSVRVTQQQPNRLPDLSKMTPRVAADRLFNRVMSTLIKSQITVLVSPMAIQVQLLAALVVMRF